MAKLAPLHSKLFLVATNGVLPGVKLNQCIEKLHSTGAVYSGPMPSDVFADKFGCQLRMIAAHWRDLKQDSQKCRVCISKAAHL